MEKIAYQATSNLKPGKDLKSLRKEPYLSLVSKTLQ